jgi:hypothetical protein
MSKVHAKSHRSEIGPQSPAAKPAVNSSSTVTAEGTTVEQLIALVRKAGARLDDVIDTVDTAQRNVLELLLILSGTIPVLLDEDDHEPRLELLLALEELGQIGWCLRRVHDEAALARDYLGDDRGSAEVRAVAS